MVTKSGLKNIIVSILILVFFSSLMLAENETINNTNEVGTLVTDSETATIENTDITEANLTSNETTINETAPLPEIKQIIDYNLTSFTPKEFKVGDVQFNIQVQNNGNVELKNLLAFISGRGLSSYDITPIDVLKPGEKSYILMTGNLREEGDLPLTIRINDKTFTQVIKVIDPSSLSNKEVLKSMEEKEAQKKAALAVLSRKFEELNQNYSVLDSEYSSKRKEKYDLSEVNLEDLKKFLRNAQSSIIAADAEQANISLTLAFNEYNYQKHKLEQAQKIKTSLLDTLKNNVVLLSAIATGIITLFGFYEFAMKKKESVSEKLTEKLKEIKASKSNGIPEKKEEEKKEERKEEVKTEEPKKQEEEAKIESKGKKLSKKKEGVK